MAGGGSGHRKKYPTQQEKNLLQPLGIQLNNSPHIPAHEPPPDPVTEWRPGGPAWWRRAARGKACLEACQTETGTARRASWGSLPLPVFQTSPQKGELLVQDAQKRRRLQKKLGNAGVATCNHSPPALGNSPAIDGSCHATAEEEPGRARREDQELRGDRHLRNSLSTDTCNPFAAVVHSFLLINDFDW